MALRDTLHRPIRDLRISVTDRCNLRCRYCMPREVFGREYSFIPRAELLTFEEIERLTRLFVAAGVRKVRFTGGEPLLRRDLVSLVRRVAAIQGLDDIALTTNGTLLTREMAVQLADAGLRRVTVSLDSLDDGLFRKMSDAVHHVDAALRAVDLASEAGLTPVKIDVVLLRGINESQIREIAERFRHSGHIVRFIEYMDVGNSNGWQRSEVVPGAEVLAQLQSLWPMEPIEPEYFGEVATRWRYLDGAGEVGIISSVTQPFCGSCTRARLSADGLLYLCLFAGSGRDLRALLRGGAADEEIAKVIELAWSARDDRYSELRSAAAAPGPKVEMSRIGG